MKVLDLIYQMAHRQGMEFILIGGHAINAIGDRRQTRDIDLAACEADKNQWKKLLLDMDYKLFNESEAFLQFSPADVAQWPVDIILVDEQTFNRLKSEANTINLGGQHDVLIPSAQHLIAMKLHTYKQGDPVRRLKDLLDIITLIRYDKTDINSDEFRQLCEKYANEEAHAEIIKIFNGPKR